MVRRGLPALLVALGAAQSAGAVTFADGLLHVLDASHSFPSEAVVVDDGPQGGATRVDVLEGAEVGTSVGGTALTALGHSIVDVSGGSVGTGFAIGLLATDASRLRISGGQIGGLGVDLRGSATLETSGGLLGGLVVDEDARLRFTGGDVFARARVLGGPSEISGGFLRRGLTVGQEAELLFSGGVVDGALEVFSTAKLSLAGSPRLSGDLDVNDAAEVSIAGGVVEGDIVVEDRGKLVVRGGQLNGRLDVEGEATVTFVGRDFVVTQNGHDIDVSSGEIPVAFGQLSGRLAVRPARVFMLFARDPGTRILLERAPLVVDVEVNPRRRSKRIDPFSRGAVSVAILGSDHFDVATVDPTSLRFGPGGAPTHGRTGGQRIDVNRDGFDDLVSRHRIAQTGIAVGDTEACIAGTTLEGEAFSGCAAIEAVPPRGLRGALHLRRR